MSGKGRRPTGVIVAITRSPPRASPDRRDLEGADSDRVGNDLAVSRNPDKARSDHDHRLILVVDDLEKAARFQNHGHARNRPAASDREV